MRFNIDGDTTTRFLCINLTKELSDCCMFAKNARSRAFISIAKCHALFVMHFSSTFCLFCPALFVPFLSMRFLTQQAAIAVNEKTAALVLRIMSSRFFQIYWKIPRFP